MASLRHNEISVPAATGFWSYKPVPVQVAEAMSMASTTSHSMEVDTPKDKNYLSNHGRFNEPVMVAASLPMKLFEAQLSQSKEIASTQFQYDNWQYRIAQPFPDATNSNEYKPPHQFYTSNSSTQSYSYSNKAGQRPIGCNRSIIANKTPQEIYAPDDSYGINEINQSGGQDFKLQRPSSFQKPIQPEHLTRFYPIYASIPFYGSETAKDVSHIMVPCPFVPATRIPLFHTHPEYPHYSTERELENADPDHVEALRALDLEERIADINEYSSPNPSTHHGQPKDDSTVSYENLNEINSKATGSSLSYRDSTNNYYGGANLDDTSTMYGNSVAQSKPCNGISILEEDEISHVSYSQQFLGSVSI